MRRSKKRWGIRKRMKKRKYLLKEIGPKTKSPS
jgi:hypothetical protein